MFNFLNRKNDYASTPVTIDNRVKDIVIPVISLEKYPEILIRVTSLVEKVSLALNAEDQESVVNNISLSDLLKYIPQIVRVAADELFDFLGFVLDVDPSVIKKLGLADLTRIINKVYQVNEFAAVQDEILNFLKALKTGQGQNKTK